MDRLQAWEIFAAVAEHGSFADAARRLGRSPAAVTRAIAALENHLSARLLNRTTRSVALTDAGARYLEACRRILSDFAELEASATGERQQPRGLLNVTAPVMFGRLYVLPIVRSFLADWPEVDVRLLFLDRVVSLIDEGLDVASGWATCRTRRYAPSRSDMCAAPSTPVLSTSHGTASRRCRRISAITAASRVPPSPPSPIAGRSSASSEAMQSPSGRG